MITTLLGAALLSFSARAEPHGVHPPAASVGLGLQQLHQVGGVADAATTARASLQFWLGPLTVGPVVQASTFDVQSYADQADDPVLPGDFALVGAGAGAALPELVEAGIFRFGLHLDLMVDRYLSAMDADYYDDVVVTGAWGGQEGLVGTRAWLLRPGAGVDLALRPAPNHAFPEVFLAQDITWRTQLGLGTSTVIGLRVGVAPLTGAVP